MYKDKNKFLQFFGCSFASLLLLNGRTQKGVNGKKYFIWIMFQSKEFNMYLSQKLARVGKKADKGPMRPKPPPVGRLITKNFLKRLI